jgi:hypothetical protein
MTYSAESVSSFCGSTLKIFSTLVVGTLLPIVLYYLCQWYLSQKRRSDKLREIRRANRATYAPLPPTNPSPFLIWDDLNHKLQLMDTSSYDAHTSRDHTLWIIYIWFIYGMTPAQVSAQHSLKGDVWCDKCSISRVCEYDPHFIRGQNPSCPGRAPIGECLQCNELNATCNYCLQYPKSVPPLLGGNTYNVGGCNSCPIGNCCARRQELDFQREQFNSTPYTRNRSNHSAPGFHQGSSNASWNKANKKGGNPFGPRR